MAKNNEKGADEKFVLRQTKITEKAAAEVTRYSAQYGISEDQFYEAAVDFYLFLQHGVDEYKRQNPDSGYKIKLIIEDPDREEEERYVPRLGGPIIY